MSEYINIEILLWVCGAIGITWTVAYFVSMEQVKKAFDEGCDWGRFDLDREVLRAENKAFVSGYEKAKKELHPFVPHGPKTPNNTTKLPSKPVNTRNSRVAQKPAKKASAKKPTVPVISPEFGRGFGGR